MKSKTYRAADVNQIDLERLLQQRREELVHADLDDPYLGLGEVLFATYPFAKEDAVH